MAIFFYNIFLFLYRAGIGIASLWNKKAKLWTDGRKNIFDRLASELRTPNSKLIWFHCSSLGEFEQGRPVIENLRKRIPNSKFLLTFFSPSGFEIRRDYKGADWVFYLPLDSKTNAKAFFDIINPSFVVFVKYDYWYYYLTECKKRSIPLLLVSGIFRQDQPFFKWYGNLHRQMLNCFTHFFVQDKESYDLLKSININEVTIAGDTRFDRVAEIAENFRPIAIAEQFCGLSPILVAGSTWPDDEETLLKAVTEAGDPNLKLIIAPHEVHENHLANIKKLFPGALWFSNYNDSTSATNEFAWNMLAKASNVLIIDNIGMLSRLYHYATVTYIGGGFNKGIHNTLEAAVYGKPVLFGPNYKKFKEATGLIETGGAVCVKSSAELSAILQRFINNKTELELTSKNSFDFVNHNRGATEKILHYIEANRLLTKL
ncbi:MAG TPA: glycosyltransferase N-terminal domain-containing protein [Chitinophagaceae bacterium]|jgi:3-deoxy-D-manno-octulosonic-acid transferase|nr:glycosyltransferase N-terminal domain-containing protein [Chitinophagaceae bacterium]